MCDHLHDLQHRALEAYPLHSEVHSCFSNSVRNRHKINKCYLPSKWRSQARFPFSTPIFMNKKGMDIIAG